MIDIVNGIFTVPDVDQALHYLDNVIVRQRTLTDFFFAPKASIELHTTHCRQVITLGGEEQVGEQVFSRIFSRWLARTHHPVYLYQRFESVGRTIDIQRI